MSEEQFLSGFILKSESKSFIFSEETLLGAENAGSAIFFERRNLCLR